MRFFNTTGPVNPSKHYALSALDRLDRDELDRLIEQERYFVLHAPRQTGKTSALLALMDHLNSIGQQRCCYVNVEAAQAQRENTAAAMRVIFDTLADSASWVGDHYLDDHKNAIRERYSDEQLFSGALTQWCRALEKPLVLLIDEIDSLVGDTLISVLRQLRTGYPQRPVQFPASVILCGVRDVRDYRIHSSQEKTVITGGSAFNIKAESLRLGNFSEAEMRQLLAQHTTDTGQIFEEDALVLCWTLTRGQPWLVNALGYQVCFREKANRDRAHPITRAMLIDAKEALILRRDTHLDQLIDKLQEERVRRVIEPILAGDTLTDQFREADLQYVRDLGLIHLERGQPLTIANAIYQEIIPREITFATQYAITHETPWYQRDDGSLDMAKLLAAFQDFFRQHSEHWIERFQYKEAGPQLLLQAFLQRIVNGGGRIEREYGLGRMRTDLLVIWPLVTPEQRIVLELKIQHGNRQDTLAKGLPQTVEYLERCGAGEGHLVIFDRRVEVPWSEKLFHESHHHGGYAIQVWGM